MAGYEKSPRERIEIRIAKFHKDEVEEAASIQGISVSAFVTSTILEAARKIRRDYHTTVLDREESEAFVRMLEDKSPPNAELRKLMSMKVIVRK